MHGTTIVSVRRGGTVAMGGDGQVTLSNTIVKHSANKLRRLHDGSVLVGFAGSTADAFTLFEKFETKLKEHRGKLQRSAVELAKEWRTDRVLRHLEALLAVAGAEESLLISGSGDVLVPDDELLAIGSGGAYALAASRALLHHTEMDAEGIVRTSLEIASEICLYTNSNIQVEVLDTSDKK